MTDYPAHNLFKRIVEVSKVSHHNGFFNGMVYLENNGEVGRGGYCTNFPKEALIAEFDKLQSRLAEADALLNHASSHLELAIDIINGKYLLEIESIQRTLAKIQAYNKGE